MNILHSVILGVVEGITEFLPISSTGHIILVTKILQIQIGDFEKSFNIAIQLGAILAVIVLYWREFFKKTIIIRLIVAFLPTALVGFILYKFVKGFLLGNSEVVLFSLFIGGLFIVGFEYFHGRLKKVELKENDSGIENISLKQSFIIGFCQSIAIIPGVSRSLATIFGGLALGLQRKTIVEFSFLLAVPTIAGATTLDLFKSVSSFSFQNFEILIYGFITAFITAIFSIKFLLSMISKYSFTPFGIYRILLAVLGFIILF
jgi:undecaprenyl-diphosphatase